MYDHERGEGGECGTGMAGRNGKRDTKAIVDSGVGRKGSERNCMS